MQEARAKYEIGLIHRRINQTVGAVNQLTEANNDARFRLRAVENLINRSWFLRMFLGVKKVNNEVAHIYQQEALAREAEDKAREAIRKQRAEIEFKKAEAEKQAKENAKKIKARQRQLNKELKNV